LQQHPLHAKASVLLERRAPAVGHSERLCRRRLLAEILGKGRVVVHLDSLFSAFLQVEESPNGFRGHLVDVCPRLRASSPMASLG
jgi:hypothetical protein